MSWFWSHDWLATQKMGETSCWPGATSLWMHAMATPHAMSSSVNSSMNFSTRDGMRLRCITDQRSDGKGRGHVGDAHIGW